MPWSNHKCRSFQHNTTLLRSIYSIINRSPVEVLHEIIVVDDFGTKDFLKKPLEDYLVEHKIDHIVKIVRTSKREGLIRARQIGAQASTADVMVGLGFDEVIFHISIIYVTNKNQ